MPVRLATASDVSTGRQATWLGEPDGLSSWTPIRAAAIPHGIVMMRTHLGRARSQKAGVGIRTALAECGHVPPGG